MEAIRKLGGCCRRCGFSDPRALQFDHVEGKGCQELRKSVEEKGQRAYYLMIIADKTGKYQLLCANCNWIKKAENGEGCRPDYNRISFEEEPLMISLC